MGADEAVDFFDEVGGGLEGATTDGALGDEGEEAFDLIEPGGIGGREVNVPTRTAGEPSLSGITRTSPIVARISIARTTAQIEGAIRLTLMAQTKLSCNNGNCVQHLCETTREGP